MSIKASFPPCFSLPSSGYREKGITMYTTAEPWGSIDQTWSLLDYAWSISLHICYMCRTQKPGLLHVRHIKCIPPWNTSMCVCVFSVGLFIVENPQCISVAAKWMRVSQIYEHTLTFVWILNPQHVKFCIHFALIADSPYWFPWGSQNQQWSVFFLPPVYFWENECQWFFYFFLRFHCACANLRHVQYRQIARLSCHHGFEEGVWIQRT